MCVMSPNEDRSPKTYTGLRKNRLSLGWKRTSNVTPMDDAPGVQSERAPVPHAPLPATVVSIADDLAAVILEPHARELTEAEKTAILAANRVQVFLDARATANLSRPLSAPFQLSDYPADTLRFCVDHATLICVGICDCRNDASADEIELLLRQFDGKEVEDSRFVIRMLTGAPFDVGDYISLHRPHVPFRVASPVRAEEEMDA
jgi:hypothetical protein